MHNVIIDSDHAECVCVHTRPVPVTGFTQHLQMSHHFVHATLYTTFLERLSRYYSKTGCNGIGMCYKKKRMEY